MGFGAGDDLDREVSREFLAFGGPIVHQGGGADDEGRSAPPPRFDEGEQLHGFAQAHLVGEDAAESLVPERGKPLEALHLVWAQHGFEVVGHAVAFRIDDFDVVDVCVETVAFAVVPHLRVEQERLVSGYGDGAGIKLPLVQIKVRGDMVELAEIGVPQIDEGPVLQPVVTAFSAIGFQQRADFVHRHLVGDWRDLDEIGIDGQSDFHRRRSRLHHAVERGGGEHAADRAEDIHAVGEHQQDRLLVLLADARHVDGAPCREQLPRHLHREGFARHIPFDLRGLRTRIGVDHSAQFLGCRHELEEEVAIARHGLAGDAMQVAVEVVFDPAFGTGLFGDFLGDIEADAGFVQLRHDGACEHGPIVFGDEHAVRIAVAEFPQRVQGRSQAVRAAEESVDGDLLRIVRVSDMFGAEDVEVPSAGDDGVDGAVRGDAHAGGVSFPHVFGGEAEFRIPLDDVDVDVRGPVIDEVDAAGRGLPFSDDVVDDDPLQAVDVAGGEEPTRLELLVAVVLLRRRVVHVEQVAYLSVREHEFAVDARFGRIVDARLHLGDSACGDHLFQESEQFRGERVEHVRRVGEGEFPPVGLVCAAPHVGYEFRDAFEHVARATAGDAQ